MDVGGLTDLEALRQLKARYFRALDAKDWTAFRAVFTDDVRVAFPGASVEWLDGPDAVVEYVSRRLAAGTVSVHHGFMPELALTGPNTATGIWAMRDEVEIPKRDGRVYRLSGAGHYHEEYRRTSEGWKISQLVLTRLRVDETISP